MENQLLNANTQKFWKEQYDLDGFIYIPGFLSLDEISALRKELDSLDLNKMPPEKVYYENKERPDTLKQLQHLFNYSPLFKETMFESKFTELANLLLGEKAIGKNMQFFNKPPKLGKPTPPHQDGYYFMLEPQNAITMWLALEDVDEENGCVRYVKGSHKEGMRPHGRTAVLGFSQAMLDFPQESDLQHEVYFRVKPGDLLAHHSLTIHWADGNQSENRTRKSLGFIYYGENAKVDEAAHKFYQEKLARELKEKDSI
ncbi:MAG: phytanoyl-CoA dioxygenase family protein [Cytophagales bacterium]|nr:phytanoyl-CoA dioxygenase family protein [Cytophagales bacterium]